MNSWIEFWVLVIVAITYLSIWQIDIALNYQMSVKDYLWCIYHQICPKHIWPYNKSGYCLRCKTEDNEAKQKQRNDEWDAFDQHFEEMRKKYGRSD